MIGEHEPRFVDIIPFIVEFDGKGKSFIRSFYAWCSTHFTVYQYSYLIIRMHNKHTQQYAQFKHEELTKSKKERKKKKKRKTLRMVKSFVSRIWSVWGNLLHSFDSTSVYLSVYSFAYRIYIPNIWLVICCWLDYSCISPLKKDFNHSEYQFGCIINCLFFSFWLLLLLSFPSTNVLMHSYYLFICVNIVRIVLFSIH